MTTKDKSRDYALRKTYGISLEDTRRMIADQDNQCLICKRSLDNLIINIDHNHTTKKVRSILCHNCNRLIGEAREDIKVLENAIQYLKKHQ